MGEEEEDFQVFRWPLADYRRLDKKVLSPEFSCGGHKWSVAPFLLLRIFTSCPTHLLLPLGATF
jgi:hypothetical protein